MRLSIVASVVLFALAGALNGATLGVSVNGTCEAGSCPAMPLPVNSNVDLAVYDPLILPDGDMYLINGSFEASSSPGAHFSASWAFQVTYEGNANGDVSASDTITVEQFNSYQTTLTDLDFGATLNGIMDPRIASSSTVTLCVNGQPNCIGPLSGSSFGELRDGIFLNNSDGAIVFNLIFTSNFGAGSPVGSYIFLGQTPLATPEPTFFVPVLSSLAGIIALKKGRRGLPPGRRSTAGIGRVGVIIRWLLSCPNGH